MKKKIFALLVGCAFVLNGIGTVLADTNTKKERQTTQSACCSSAGFGRCGDH
ncbi:MAG: hypothetical protein WKF71_03955 [Pyrinomonadaceae bacterium]